MAQLRPQLTPFWHVPEGQDDQSPARFRLRPLTEPQMLEVMDRSDKTGRLQNAAYALAADYTIIEIADLNDSTGKPVKWPRDKSTIPWELVVSCGAAAIVASMDHHAENELEALEKN